MIHAFVTVGVILACGVGAVSSSALFKEVEGCSTAEVEECGFDFVPFFKSTRLAETAEELQDQCQLFKGQLQCVENFVTACLEGLPKVIVHLLVKAAKDEYDSICNNATAKHQGYIDNIAYINKAGPAIHACLNDFFVALHRATTAPVNQQMAYSCCYHEDFLECTDRALKSQCNVPASSKICKVITDKVVDNGLSLFCSKYKKGTGACEALPALSTKNDSCAIGRGFIQPVIVLGENLG